MADVAADLKTWSTTAASNSPADATTVGSGLADNLQEIQKVVRQDLAHKGADIASAGTTDLGAVVGLMHDITGTTTITSFGTVSAGIWKFIKFENVLTLTHNATSLILPGAANITTANGDTAIVMSEGSGNWRCLAYTKATGAQTVESPVSGMVLLDTKTASASASLQFTLSSSYTSYEFRLEEILEATTGTAFRMTQDNDTSAVYVWTRAAFSETALTAAGTGAGADTGVVMTAAMQNSSTRYLTGRVWFDLLQGAVTWQLGYQGTGSGRPEHSSGHGSRPGSADPTTVEFKMGTGNITSGRIYMYGMRK